MRVQFNDGQEVIYQDQNKQMQLVEKYLLERLVYQMVDREDGFFGDSFKVDYTDSTHTSVRAGLGVQDDTSQVSPESTKRMLYKASATAMTHATPDPTDDRIDLVVIKHNRATTSSESRQIKDAITDVVAPQTIVTETDWAPDLLVVTGTPDPSPVAPSVPTGYVKLAEVLVTASTGISGSGAITDSRNLMPINEDINIDSSAYENVPTQAVDTPLKTVLAELDALAVAYAGILQMYDAIVGTVGAGSIATHSSIAAALADVSAGARILVLENQTINTTIAVSLDNIEIDLKPGVVLSKGTATTGFNVTGDGFKIHGGKISGFNGGTDVAISFATGALYGMVWGMRFASNDTDVDDSNEQVAQWGNVNE